MRSKHPSAACSAHCSNSPWLLCHLSAFPTYLTPCRLHFISCQLFRETHSGRSWTRGTFWHISGYSEECWQLLEVLHSAVQWAGGEGEQEGPAALTGRWLGWRGCPPALGSGGSWLCRRPPAPTCGCWFCVPPSSSACPRCHPRPGERLCPLAATACSREEGKDLSPPPQEHYPHVTYSFIINTPQWWYKCLNPCIWHRRSPCSQNAFWAQSSLSLESLLKAFNAQGKVRNSCVPHSSKYRDVHGAQWVFIPKKALSCSQKLKALV